MEPIQNETPNAEGVSTDAGSSSTEETTTVTADAGVTSTPEVTEEAEAEKTEEELDEPETTLDEEAEADAEVEVTGVPEGTVKPEEAPVDAEYLAVVNSSGFTKYVLPASEAVENATKGGYSVRVATDEEVEAYKRANKIA